MFGFFILEVEHQSVGISSGGSVGGQFAGNMANGLLTGVNGSASSTTQSAVSEGTITIRDKDKQTQNIGDLSRDVENANPGLDKIFDKEKEQNRLKEAQLIGEIGSQVGDIVRTQGQIIATKAANEKMQNVTQADRDAAEKQWRKDHPGQEPKAEDNRRSVGHWEGDLVSGSKNTHIATLVDRKSRYTIILKPNSALVGAAGAATAELMAPVIIAAMGWDEDNLSEDQKQTVSALATLAAGLAGGLTGDSTADTVAGAQTGKNAVENIKLVQGSARSLMATTAKVH